MDVSIIIGTYNRCSSLCQVLNDLAVITVPLGVTHEIIVIDNNSTDGTRAAVEALARENNKLKYGFEPRQGVSKARNAGIAISRGRILAFTDDDVQIDKSWLVAMWGAFKEYDCMGVGGKIIPLWSGEKPWWYEDEGPFRLMAAIVRFDLGEQSCDLHCPGFTANMAFRRVAFEKYGLFREDLGPNGEILSRGEDTEFCWRLMRGSEKVIYAPKMIVYHPVEEKRTKQDYFKTWYFNYGKTAIRTEGKLEQAVCYFGVPRFLIRQLIRDLWYWVMCTEAKRRFYYKLQVYQTVGEIAECRSLVRLGQPTDAPVRRS